MVTKRKRRQHEGSSISCQNDGKRVLPGGFAVPDSSGNSREARQTFFILGWGPKKIGQPFLNGWPIRVSFLAGLLFEDQAD